MGSVLSVWHDYREAGIENPSRAQVPGQQELQNAAEHVNLDQVQIDEQASTVYLPDEAMSLDVGAIAKGYATKRLAETLKEAGVTSALLSLGGNVETIGTKADGKPWRVGVQNPDTSAAKAYLHVLKLTDTCLVTSGTYQRYYGVDGVRYHHIIDPDTLMPWRILTIRSPSSATTAPGQMPCPRRSLIWTQRREWPLWKHRTEWRRCGSIRMEQRSRAAVSEPMWISEDENMATVTGRGVSCTAAES